jgi:Xaa-Pro aminopeptidase
MQSREIDTLIASSTENVYYVSNYWSLGKQLGCGVETYAVLPQEGDPVLIAPFKEADIVLDSGTWIPDLRFYGPSYLQIGEINENSEQTQTLQKLHKRARPEDNGVKGLIKALNEKQLERGTIALDSSTMPPRLHNHLTEKLPDAKIVDGTSFLKEIRLVKTSTEIECIKRATEITEKSMEDALEIARSEIMEMDLASMFAYSIAYDGGRVSQNMIGFRERSAFLNPTPSDFEAARGDIIRMTFGCKWLHYHSNISRTAVIGRAPAKARKIWEVVENAQDVALDMIKPGEKVSDVYSAVEKELESLNYGACPSFGHSLGVECNERPWIEKESEEMILEGMILNVDIPYLELGWGGIQLEDTLLVTHDGIDLLTKTDRTLYLL